jgi:hypothetical protein
MQLSNRWHVQLGEGGRRMTDSQVKAAAARCWIDAETPVRKPQSSEWTKLGDVAPAKRMAKEESVSNEETAAEDITTSGMILTSGEFELVDDDAAPSKEELKAARPPRLAPKLFVVALAMLAGGAVLARRHIPKLDAELDAIVTAMRPAPMPTSTPTPAAVAPTAPAAVAPTPMTVSSTATLVIVPKMRAPAIKMREPSPPPAKKTPKAATVTHKRGTSRH